MYIECGTILHTLKNKHTRKNKWRILEMTSDAPEISGYFHCGICMSGKLAVGWTKKGLQVFCEKCNKNVLILDFLGQQMSSRSPTLVIQDGMKSRAEIEKKFEELNEQMAKLSPGQLFEVASTDGQRFILEWVLGQHEKC